MPTYEVRVWLCAQNPNTPLQIYTTGAGISTVLKQIAAASRYFATTNSATTVSTKGQLLVIPTLTAGGGFSLQLQRLQAEVPAPEHQQALRNSKDPAKLRDAIVAQVSFKRSKCLAFVMVDALIVIVAAHAHLWACMHEAAAATYYPDNMHLCLRLSLGQPAGITRNHWGILHGMCEHHRHLHVEYFVE